MEAPIVSVIMPMYNAEKYVAETIKSVQNQTLNDWELIIVDDGSTDSSLSIVENFAKKDSRIVVLKQSNSGRPAVPKNVGVSIARGEFICFLDNDDLYEPTKLSCQVDALYSFSDYNVVFSDMGVFENMDIRQSKSYLGSVNWFERATPYLKPLQSGLYGCLVNFYEFMSTQVTSLTTQTVMLRSSAVPREEGPFEESLWVSDDIDLWFRLAINNKVLYIDKILAFYRRHENNITASSFKGNEGFVSAHLRNLERAHRISSPENIRIIKSKISRAFFHLGYHNINNDSFQRGRSCYLNSMRLDFSIKTTIAWLKSFVLEFVYLFKNKVF